MASKSSGDGNWVTINGVHVLIGANGKITKGPAKFIGSRVEDLPGGKNTGKNLKASSTKSTSTTKKTTTKSGGTSKSTTSKTRTNTSNSTKSDTNISKMSDKELISEFKKVSGKLDGKLDGTYTGGFDNFSKSLSLGKELRKRGYDTSPNGDLNKMKFEKTTPKITKEVKSMSDKKLLDNYDARTKAGVEDAKTLAMGKELSSRGYGAVSVDSWGAGGNIGRTIYSKDIEKPSTQPKTVKVSTKDNTPFRDDLTTKLAKEYFDNKIGFADFEKKMEANNITIAERSVIQTKLEQLSKGNSISSNPAKSSSNMQKQFNKSVGSIIPFPKKK